MNLNDRLKAIRDPHEVLAPAELDVVAVSGVANGTVPNVETASEPAEPLVHSSAEPRAAAPHSRREPAASDPLAAVKEKAAQELFVRIGSRLSDSTLTEQQLHQLARSELAEIVAAEQLAMSTSERNRLIDDIGAEVLGYGPLEELLNDASVTEIMVNRYDQLYVERNGRLVETAHRFTGEPQLRRVIERIVARVGRRIDEASPLVDARLEDGSRVNAIIPPLAVNGSSLTIRKFSATPYTTEDLINFGTMTREVTTVLDAAVRAKMNILVSGGTGTGKTTLLNVLSAFIPRDERIITIEDAVELQLQQDHVVRLESRPPNIEGRGEITIRELVRNSLRMRPDRIVVGEVRGGESLDMLQAMNTGHEGSISTVHANSPRDALSRMETLVLMAGMDLPLRAIREQISSAIDIIVQITRHKDGVRRVTHVSEVHGMEGEVITLQDAFSFDYSAGYDEEGRLRGRLEPTGVRPRFAERIADHGIALPVSIFQPEIRTLLGEIR
ncbi:pilus assembly protein CpaF [Agromyces sp. Root81]|uniref:CpaF family protein n=1 Tax=Agromyces sp. Root81 TaxID=1736601 RepID=UPI0006F22E7E|nr:CpaF family protein [Agromyces sp. Root81]KRC61913.1 pilus assembly protein CpaF [Agromyces sp. Root81]